MSQENVEIVRAQFDAFNRGDFEAANKDAAPDGELDWSRAVGPEHGVFRFDSDQARRFWDELRDPWESVQVEPEEFIEVGEQVVVPQTGYMRGRDGIEVRARITQVFTIREGKIVRICLYQDKREALEAAGLSE
jgi:ketosteroid isomerase-like protein